ncbi:hypothetical protein MRX96_015677 [Rhipicephalus microplus]
MGRGCEASAALLYREAEEAAQLAASRMVSEACIADHWSARTAVAAAAAGTDIVGEGAPLSIQCQLVWFSDRCFIAAVKPSPPEPGRVTQRKEEPACLRQCLCRRDDPGHADPLRMPT